MCTEGPRVTSTVPRMRHESITGNIFKNTYSDNGAPCALSRKVFVVFKSGLDKSWKSETRIEGELVVSVIKT
jgi:hypothetical protein